MTIDESCDNAFSTEIKTSPQVTGGSKRGPVLSADKFTQMYRSMTASEMARRLGISMVAVTRRAKRLGIRQPWPKYLRVGQEP